MGICESADNTNSMKNNNADTKLRNEYKINESLSLNKDITDKILTKLLQGGTPGIQINLKEEEIKYIIEKSLPIIKQQDALLELQAPLNICGDIHGQFSDLLKIFGKAGYPDKFNYLFLGNYVDFGKNGIEVLCLLLCFKIKYPEKIWLLRGNHESSENTRIYGFYDECKRKYNVRLYRNFIEIFNYLPFAALIDERIFCVHGGLSPELKNIKVISEISIPTDIPDTGILCDLLNSDPDEDTLEFDENDKGISCIFGEKIVYEFLKKNDLDLIVRGNQVADSGFKFFAQKKLVTVFSAPNFNGDHANAAGILKISSDLNCDFLVIKN